MKLLEQEWIVLENKVPGYTRTISVVTKDGVAIANIPNAGSLNPAALAEAREVAEAIASLPRLLALRGVA